MGRRQTARISSATEDQGAIGSADGDRGATLRLYLDTSALVKLHVEEEGSRLVRDSVDQARIVATSMIAYVEARAAFARRRTQGDLSPAAHERIVADFDIDWERYLRLEVAESLIVHAAGLAEVHRLRALDSIHLASAKVVRHDLGKDVVFGSWDTDLERAAIREGFQPFRSARRRLS
jgi:predicted nucleic acid-binding protein